MPTLQYPNNPNTDTAFVVQDDGTKNRALMTAPQDTSTLELPSNPNSTKGYVTIDGKKQRVVLTADISGAGGDQHNLGWYATESALTTAYPTATAGDFAIVNSTDTVWLWDTDTSSWKDGDTKGQVTSVNNQTGAVTITGADILPSQTGNAGKFLVTNGTSAGWSNTISNNSNSVSSLTLDNAASGGYKPFLKCNQAIGSLLLYGYGISNFCISTSSPLEISKGIMPGDSPADLGFSNSLSQTVTKWNCVYTDKISSAYNKFVTVPSVGGEMAVKQVNTTITLTSAGWSSNTQTVSVTGMTATGLVFVSPVPTDQSAYTSAGVLCTAQAAGALTFTCTSVPSGNISVSVVML